LESERNRLLESLKHRVNDSRVIEAMGRVPREVFVPSQNLHLAYSDIPISIGQGQTVSQPYMVAIMMQALSIRATDKVLDVGTGSGYQAAILAEMAAFVVSVERIPELALSAKERLDSLGYTNVRVVLAEKKLGWQKEAPYQSIVIGAGAPRLDKGLMSQLDLGGSMVIPVGSKDSQSLIKVTRTADDFTVEVLCECRFVPLIGDGAWPEVVGLERS